MSPRGCLFRRRRWADVSAMPRPRKKSSESQTSSKHAGPRGADSMPHRSIVLAGAELAENAWFADVAHGAGLLAIREPDIDRLRSWYTSSHGPVLICADADSDHAVRQSLPAD